MSLTIKDSTGTTQTLKTASSGGELLPAHIAPGAANFQAVQVGLATTVASILASRATRRKATFRNTDAAINMAIGLTGISITTGYLLLPGAEVTLETTAQVFGIAASGTPKISISEFWD
jgi:multisubunit Na+/H+ antiporter MnhB subunit